MRSALLLFVLAGPLAGQTTVRLMAGAVSSSSLVNDDILDTQLRPATAPAVSAAISLPTGRGPWRLVAEGTYARAPLDVSGSSGTDRLASVAMITTLVLFEGPVAGPIRWQLGGGAIFYRPSQRQGVFQDGMTRRWMVTGGVTWSHPLSARMTLLVDGRLDTEEFSTSALQRYGYESQQNVRRGTLMVGIERRL